MRCPSCKSYQISVTDSRPKHNLDAIVRKRKCLSCGRTWVTIERALSIDTEAQLKEFMKDQLDGERLSSIKSQIKILLKELDTL